MKRLVITSIMSFCFQMLFSQDVLYIRVDPSCMDRFEYHINGESMGVEYISYRVRQGEKNFTFLDVASESKGYQLSAPDMIECKNLSLSNNFIDKINRKELFVYIVRKDEIGYNISEVTLASSVSFENNLLKYHTFDSDFQSNIDYVNPEINLTDLDASNEIYAGGSGSAGCLKEYYYHKVSKESCKPAIGLVFVPEIGMTKEITGKSLLSDHESTLTLVRVNDVSMDTYLGNICTQKSQITMADQYYVAPSETVITYTETIAAPVVTESTTTKVESSQNVGYTTGLITFTPDAVETTSTTVVTESIPTSVPVSFDVATEKKSETTKTKVVATNTVVEKVKCKDVATKDFHVVQQGETLYGIARRYGLRTDQLQDWNKLNGNLISPCSKLRILPSEKPASYDIPNTLVAKGGETVKTETKATATEQAWKGSKAKIHEVAKGDSYYSIAQKYGYTVDRLLEMNGLDEDQKLAIGQKIQVSDCVCDLGNVKAPKGASKIVSAPKAYEFTSKGGLVETKSTKKDDKKEDKKDLTAITKVVTYKRQTIHIVNDNETLGQIAAKYGIPEETLMQINHLDKGEELIPNAHIFLD
jgi:LysM repeat protein